MSHLRTLNFKVSEDVELRTAQLGDEDHLVVPVVALVEGVLFPSNAEAPELALASEFGKFPSGWNGRPLMLGHPKDSEGNPVSANSPDLWDSSVVGMMFNTQLDGKKLKSEMWVNKAKAGEDLISRFNEGVVEVSTGLYTQTEESGGVFNGNKYEGVWRNIVPDHLAILDEGTVGACSVEDGCGAPRNNTRIPVNTPQPKVSEHTECACDSCKKQSAAKIADKETDLAALNAFFHNTSGFKAKNQAAFAKALRGLKNLLGMKDNELSDVDKSAALTAALKTESTAYCYIVAIYANSFIYVCYDYDVGSKLYQRNYSIAEGGTISLAAEYVEVRAETKYVPVSVSIQESQLGDTTMTTPQDDAKVKANQTTVDALTAKAGEARAYLGIVLKDNAADLAALPNKTDLEAIELAACHKATVSAQKTADEEKAKAEVLAKANAAQTDIASYVAAAPEAFRGQLSAANEFFVQRKALLVKALIGKGDMSESDLNALPPAMLEKMAKAVLANGVAPGTETSFVGGNPTPAAQVVDNEKFTPVTMEAFPMPSATTTTH